MNWNKLKKPTRIAATIAGVAVALVVLVVLLLLLQPVRTRILGFALDRANRALPGTLSVVSARWPSPSAIELKKFLWVDGPDTLAAAGRLEVSVKLRQLLSRDVHITNLVLAEGQADIPAITRRFAGEQPPGPEPDGNKGGGFPRSGSLPLAPSIAVDHLQVEARYIRIADVANLENVRVLGSINLLHGYTPVVRLDELTLLETTNGAAVDSLWLAADLSTMNIAGKGVIRFRTTPDIYLDCSSGNNHEFSVRLTAVPGAAPPQAAGLAVNGRAELENGRLRRVEYRVEFLTPGTGDLAGIEPVTRLLAGLPVGLKPLEGIGGRIDGMTRVTPDFFTSATIDMFRNSWLDSVHAVVAYDQKKIVADSLLLALPGLRLDGSGGTESGGGFRARLEIAGTRWLTNIVSDVSPPDTLFAAIDVEAGGLAGREDTRVGLTASGRVNAFTLDNLLVNASLPASRPPPNTWTVDVNGSSMGLQLLTRIEASLPTDEKPIRVVFRKHPDPVTDRTIALAGDLVYTPAERSIAVSDLLLTGAAGTVSANARLDSLMRGPIDLVCEWARPPAALLAVQAVDSATFERLALSWGEDGPFSLSAAGHLGRAGTAITAGVSGRLRLPGPRNISPYINPELSVADLGPVSGLFSVNTTSCDGGAGIEAIFDLGETAWLDTAQVSLTVCGGGINIDSLKVLFEGLRVYAQGGRSADNWDLQVNVSLADSQLVRRLEAKLGSKLNMSLDAVTHITGPAETPEINSTFRAAIVTPKAGIPALVGKVTLGPDSLLAELNTPDGATSNWIVADKTRFVYQAGRQNNGLANGNVKIDAQGPDLVLLVHARPLTGEATGVSADSLYVRMSGHDLASRNPFTIRYSPAAGLNVDHLHLAGSIGFVRANGSVSRDAADLTAEVVVALPEKPEFFPVADRTWPDSIYVDAKFETVHTFGVTGLVSGIQMPDGTPVQVRLVVSSDTLAARANVSIDSPVNRLLSLNARLPGYTLKNPFGGPVVADIVLDQLPIARSLRSVLEEGAEELGRLNGEIAVRGSLADPSAVGVLGFDFAHGLELANYNLTIEGILSGAQLADTTLVRLRDTRFRTRLKNVPPPPGLAAVLSFDKAGRPAASIDLEYPLHLSFDPFESGIREGGQMSLRMEINDLALTDLDPLVPPDLDLEGNMSLRFNAEGAPGNPTLGGSLTTNKLRVVKGRVAQIAPDINLVFGGTLGRPAVSGEIKVRTGLIRMPKQQSSLHPVKGDAILWKQAPVPDPADSKPDQRLSHRKQNEADNKELPEMDIDIQVVIPSSFRITGEKMQVLMAGDLRVIQKGRDLTLTGELQPQEGFLQLMGRNFEIRRGRVSFYGGDELNPSFDLTLTADISEYRVEIKMTGTLDEPVIALTSDPALSESDIASLMLFGKPMTDLNSSESGMLQQRTAEILLVYGAAKLQAEMGEQLGVDLVTVQGSTRKPDQSALIVGKYLNSRTMIKYEQNLQDTASYLINLEYYLTKQLKLETFIDQLSNTGAEINWTKDY
jgi:hypothetical protein